MQKHYHLSDVLYDQAEVQIKIIDLETGKDCIIKLSDSETINSMIDDFISAKDVQAIGFLQAQQF